MAAFSVDGMPARDLTALLRKRHGIVVKDVKEGRHEWVRVAPAIYTTLEEVDRLTAALRQILA